MNQVLRNLSITLSLTFGVLNGAQAIYGEANPLQYMDPEGLNPGDVFPTRDKTALDAGQYARNQPKARFIEYGGWIYPVPGGYSYNMMSGAPTFVPINNIKKSCPAPPTDSWHIHPTTAADNDHPETNSLSDEKGPDGKRHGDIPFADDHSKVPIYLTPPQGPTVVYDPVKKTIRTLK